MRVEHRLTERKGRSVLAQGKFCDYGIVAVSLPIFGLARSRAFQRQDLIRWLGCLLGFANGTNMGHLAPRQGGPVLEQWTCSGPSERRAMGRDSKRECVERGQGWAPRVNDFFSQCCGSLAQTHHDFSYSRAQVHRRSLCRTGHLQEHPDLWSTWEA